MKKAAFNVTIINDSKLEISENFYLRISSVPRDVNFGNPDQATVTIVDDDGGK